MSFRDISYLLPFLRIFRSAGSGLSTFSQEMESKVMTNETPHPSWRQALAPGVRHGFWNNPGWWDLHSTKREEEDDQDLRQRLLYALPPLPPGSAVVDLGAGTGNLVDALADFYPHIRFTLIDPNAAALARAEEKLAAAHPGLDVSFLAEAIEPDAGTPLPGSPYTLATSSIALHDIVPPAPPDDSAAQEEHRRLHIDLLRRIRGSLSPGGHLIYADAMRATFRAIEHLSTLREAGFSEVDAAYVQGASIVCGGQRV